MYKDTQTGATAAPLSISRLKKMKRDGEKIACLTAYDASFAVQADQAGVDLVLVGDSLGMVIQGHETTVPVTVDDIVYHTKMVARGLSRAFLVADMPFASYGSVEAAYSNAARLMQEGGARMVKLEGGPVQIGLAEYLAGRGIPVCAHLGLQPQFVHKLGGYKVQGREASAAEAMRDDAKRLVEAGADLLLLECVPSVLAKQIATEVSVPVIGIGAGPDADGQILVIYDILAISAGKRPKFSKDFLQSSGSIPAALQAYVRAVKERQFPEPIHEFV
ncbi:MAG: 3-methyl-2-oxobutanoate hydroxymethyltransferase [Pseudomonadota bacterium]|nr:3-methyl-2-oxobutanoate hydroxymethyltransferase [Pseudomonadota bacterium]